MSTTQSGKSTAGRPTRSNHAETLYRRRREREYRPQMIGSKRDIAATKSFRRSFFSSQQDLEMKPRSKRMKGAELALSDWLSFLDPRWDCSARVLNLAGMRNDNFIIEQHLDDVVCLDNSTLARLVFQSAAQLEPQLLTLNLEDNKYSASTLVELVTHLPHVINLSLGANEIYDWSSLDNISYGRLKLQELSLLNTPLRETAIMSGQLENYEIEALRRFPSLDILDGCIMSQHSIPGSLEIVPYVGIQEINQETISDINQETISDINQETISDINQETISDINQETISDINRVSFQSDSEGQADPSTSHRQQDTTAITTLEDGTQCEILAINSNHRRHPDSGTGFEHALSPARCLDDITDCETWCGFNASDLGAPPTACQAINDFENDSRPSGGSSHLAREEHMQVDDDLTNVEQHETWPRFGGVSIQSGADQDEIWLGFGDPSIQGRVDHDETWLRFGDASIQSGVDQGETWIGFEDASIQSGLDQDEIWLGFRDVSMRSRVEQDETWLGFRNISTTTNTAKQDGAWVGFSELSHPNSVEHQDAWPGFDNSSVPNSAEWANTWLGFSDASISKGGSDASSPNGIPSAKTWSQRSLDEDNGIGMDIDSDISKGDDIRSISSRSALREASECVNGTPSMSEDRRLNAALEDLVNSPLKSLATRQDVALVLQAVRDVHHSRVESSLPQRSPDPFPEPQLFKHRPAEVVELQDDVRRCAEILMKVHEIDPETEEPIPVSFASPEEVDQFSRTGKARDGPNADDFKIDLSCVTSRWNKRAARVFAESFVNSNQYRCTNVDTVAKAFTTHLKTIRLRYLEAAEDGEYSQDKRDEEIHKARQMRRRNCLYRRSRVCDHYGSDPSMRRAAELFSTLTVDIMSGDETAHEGGKVRYAVTKLKWRNPAVHAWMTTLDRLHLSTRFTAAGRASRGAFPHIRIPSSRSEHVDPVVPGLPINFYNPAYLRQLDGPQRDNLCMQNEFDMTFTPQIIRLAARFASVTSRATPPLPWDHPSLPSLLDGQVDLIEPMLASSRTRQLRNTGRR